MTVLDEVLTAEKASEQKRAEAKEAAVAAVLTAKKEQGEALISEQKRLAETEKTELANHTKQVAVTVESITQDAHVKVQAVESKFAQKSADIVQKIKAALG
jgi:Holliday junction resolvasome RuvABC endonuclease subunit